MILFARESIPLVLPFFALAALGLGFGLSQRITALSVAGGVLCFVGLLVLLFFRDPDRRPPAGEELVVSPADGKIIESGTLSDGRQHVAIFLSVFDVHINRAPVAGTVRRVTYTPGTYLHAGSAGAATGNARVDVEAETAYGVVSWRQVSGLIARKISCRVDSGARLQRGERFGLIYFGSRMDVFLPSQAELRINMGERVRAGETVIARFPQRGSTP